MRYLAHANLTIVVRHERVSIKVSLTLLLVLPASNVTFSPVCTNHPGQALSSSSSFDTSFPRSSKPHPMCTFENMCVRVCASAYVGACVWNGLLQDAFAQLHYARASNEQLRVALSAVLEKHICRFTI